MFTQARKFGFNISGDTKLTIQTEPIGGSLKVFVGISRLQRDKKQRITATVFKVNKDFTHKEILDAPYTHTDDEDVAVDLSLDNYRTFKKNVISIIQSHLNTLRGAVSNRSDEIGKVDSLLRIVSLGMRHPDETIVNRGLLNLVKK